MRLLTILSLLLAALVAQAGAVVASMRVFSVRDYGAVGDGVALDTTAINKTIEAAAGAGGGIVRFPAGTYLSFSIRLKSNLTLSFEEGSTLMAATPAADFGAYDFPESNEWGEKFQYQDFGHSHWHNSLIWGENLENISLLGPGLIHGKGLVRNPGGRRSEGPNGTAVNLPAVAGSSSGRANAPGVGPISPPAGGASALPGNVMGVGNKAIGLKNCRNVVIRDLSLLLCGHFAVLATGVDNLTIENLTVDTNRDGFDLDACRKVTVTNCRVNTPNDDAIVLKSSYALGIFRDTEDVSITGCFVSGYDAGTFLNGTKQHTLERAPDRDGPTGRIKIGTESSGGFKRVTITDCIFEHSRGLALETVDGGVIEDITIEGLVMRDIVNSPIFIRLGNRGRSPAGTPVGAIRRVKISDVTVTNADARYASIIAGLPGHPVEKVDLKNIRIEYKGGLTLEQVAQQPTELINSFFLRGPGLTGPRDPFAPPEQEKAYPEPSMFGLLPAYGFFVRHARNVSLENVEVSYTREDKRSPVVLQDVAGIAFARFKAERAGGVPLFVLKNVTGFTATNNAGFADVHREKVEDEAIR
jgi:polygalacturonase